MDQSFRFMPESASSIAPQIDALWFFITGVTVFFSVLIGVAVIFCAIKFRRRTTPLPTPVAPEDSPAQPTAGKHHVNMVLEVTWTVIPLLIVMVIFFWSAKLFIDIHRSPKDPLNLYAIGKQWMWKIQHPDGQREINSMHVPIGREIKLTIASQDVIHSFYVPAFRLKQDAVPGRYTSMSFTPTKPGTYHLFCAEYCGTEHSKMIGKVVVMQPEEYEKWLAGVPIEETPISAGNRLFQSLGCQACHAIQAPTMSGLYLSKREYLENPWDTETKFTVANETYLRESILNSTAKVIKGYSPIMPGYRGQIGEEQLQQLIAYIKSLQNAPHENAARNVIEQSK